jgi:hypothetical protein
MFVQITNNIEKNMKNMLKDLDNCFYCQGLENPLKVDKCDFCGIFNNPLYLVNYQNKEKFFCCGCAWWHFPRSKAEKEAENK